MTPIIFLAGWYGVGLLMAPLNYALWLAHWQRRWGFPAADDSRREALIIAAISIGMGSLSLAYTIFSTRGSR